MLLNTNKQLICLLQTFFTLYLLLFLTPSTFAATTPLTGVTSLWSGGEGGAGSMGCARMSNGTIKCWGALYNTPVATEVSGITGVSMVDMGQNHTCALIGSAVKCWHGNNTGQLGDGTTTYRAIASPFEVMSSGVSSIALGAGYSCVVTTGGGVKCWGENQSGKLGNGDDLQQTTPVNSNLTSGVSTLVAGEHHVCALLTDNTVKCWGYGTEGSLGQGANVDSYIAVSVSSLSNVTAITAGYRHTCALINTGDVKCWGWGGQGQLGDGSSTNSNIPVTVSGLGGAASDIAIGSSHSCAVVGGTVKCWGWNPFGQLGNGTTVNSNTPVSVTGLTGVTSIAAGQHHTCALLTGGTVKCWGWNQFGQLGNNTTTDSNVPVEVIAVVPDTPPTATSVNISLDPTGTPTWVITENLKGNYTYNDLDSDLESGTTFKWYQATDSACTVGKTALGVTTQIYTVSSGDFGKYICFGVTPKNANGTGTEYLATSASTISKKNQTITFAALATKTYGDPTFTVSASADSFLPVSFTVSGNCSISTNTITITGAGSCTVTAAQTGNTTYNPATAVPQTFTINQKAQVITFTPSTTGVILGTATLSATGGGSTSPVTFATTSIASICTVNTNVVTYVGVGACILTANQLGDADHLAATQVQVTVNVTATPSLPLATSGLTAAATSPTQINLSWTDNSSDETGFKIESPAGTLITTTAANVTSYSHTGLICNTTYNYVIKATNSAGDSASITASATTQACPLIPPVIGNNSPPSYTVITQVAGTGTGSIAQTNVSVTTGQTAKIQLTAIPATGSKFIGWSNSFAPECVGSSPDVTVSVNAIKTCIATFEIIKQSGFRSSIMDTGALDFGNIPIAINRSFTISENGNIDLIISNPTLSGDNASDFKIITPQFPLTIPDGAPAQIITAQCKPSSEGTRTARLQFTTNDPQNPTVQYALNCNATSLDIGGVVSVPTAKYSSLPVVNQAIMFGSALIGQ